MEVNSHQVNIEEFFHHTIKALSEPNSLLIIMQASIGDFIANGCLAHAQKKKYNKELILVVQDRLSGLKVKFDGISKIKYIPFRVMYPLVLYILNTGRYEDINEGYVFGHFKVDIKIAIDHYLYDKELNFFDRYKKNVFDLPLNTKIHNPIIEDINDEDKSRLNKQYFLNPFSIPLGSYNSFLISSSSL